jgi:general secretion pathway protein D
VNLHLVSWSGTVEGVFKFFESENLGEVIARPKVSVRDKMKGRIQIGSDISIKQRDFAGNVIDVFYSTGTIIEVTPFIIMKIIKIIYS